MDLEQWWSNVQKKLCSILHTQSFQGLHVSLMCWDTKYLLKILHRDFEEQQQWTIYIITLYTVLLKSKLPPSRETRIASRDTRLSSLETRLSRVLKKWKYGCLNFSWEFSSLMLTVQQQRSQTLRYLTKLRLRALASRTVYHVHIKKM